MNDFLRVLELQVMCTLTLRTSSIAIEKLVAGKRHEMWKWEDNVVQVRIELTAKQRLAEEIFGLVINNIERITTYNIRKDRPILTLSKQGLV